MVEELAALSMPTLVVPGVDAPTAVAEAYAGVICNAHVDPGTDLVASIETLLQDVASS